MKVYAIFENGEDEELDVLEASSVSQAIELAKEFLAKRKEWRKVKRFEVEEDFLP